jgi:hypothetical protein
MLGPRAWRGMIMSIDTNTEIEAIRRLKARYFRTMDTKDWAGWRTSFTDDMQGKTDVLVSTGGRDGQTQVAPAGGDAFVAWVRSSIEPAITVHHGHMGEIDILSPTTAAGIWAMEDIVEWPDGKLLRAYGHYHETYRKEGGQWKIATLHLTRTRIDLSGPWDGVMLD